MENYECPSVAGVQSEESAVRHTAGVGLDPAVTDPDKYKVIFENDRVRVLDYTDAPGDRTNAHKHPDSVMIALSSYRRRLVSGEARRDVELQQGIATWLPAQQHYGENIGRTCTHAIFIELKDTAGERRTGTQLGPELGPKAR
jgi:hypothetical protein